MRRFLLFAATAIFAVTVNAQAVSKSVVRKSAELSQVKKNHFEAVLTKDAGTPVATHVKMRDLSSAVKGANAPVKNLKATSKAAKIQKAPGAESFAEYYLASGTNRSSESVSWNMRPAVLQEEDETETPCLVNVIPTPFNNLPEIPVTYEMTASTSGTTSNIKIPAQQVATASYTDSNGESQPLYCYFVNIGASSADGSENLTLEEDGTLTATDYYYAYVFFMEDAVNWSKIYTYMYYTGVSYSKPGEAPKDVAFATNNLVLFANIGRSGYNYTNNFAITGVDAPLAFINTTSGYATDWEWSADETVGEDTKTLTGSERDFEITTVNGGIYEEFKLVGSNEGAAADPFVWGYGLSKDSETGEPNYNAFYLYAGGSEKEFTFSDGTKALMSRQNLDGDLAFYTNWGTPGIAPSSVGSIARIYSYQGKPAAPLYFTSVVLPIAGFTAEDNFTLHMTLRKCSRSSSGSLTLGDVIAEADATSENVDATYAASTGLTYVTFQFYTEDEFGATQLMDHLFIEDEFAIVIDGWDNGTFAGRLGSQTEDNGPLQETWFDLTDGKVGDMYAYTGWNPAMLIGFEDAAYGYLTTKDATDLEVLKEGGEFTINVEPCMIDVDENEKFVTELWLENEDEAPEWADFEIANENYVTDEDSDLTEANFDLIITVDALPEGEEERTGTLVFAQEGALLKVNITQSNVSTGITTVKTEKVANNGTFNVAGQRISRASKGLFIENGKKLIRK